jgi:hypothetical protein
MSLCPSGVNTFEGKRPAGIRLRKRSQAALKDIPVRIINRTIFLETDFSPEKLKSFGNCIRKILKVLS